MSSSFGKVLLAMALALGLTGCYTEYVLKPPAIVGKQYAEGGGIIAEHYQTQNYGWYLFDKFPLVSGNIDGEHEGMLVFFCDDVRTDLLTKKFNEHLKKYNLRPAAVATLNNDAVTIDVPALSIPIVVPYVICYREVQISAVLLKNEEGELEHVATK